MHADNTSDERVRDTIEDTIKINDASPRCIKCAFADILQRGSVASRQEIADDPGINITHHIWQAMKSLEDRNLVNRFGSGDDETADFAFERAEELHERQARQRRAENIIEDL